MPIYEYECSKCGYTEEVFQKISDPPLERCRKCEGSLKKLISQSSFHLKGTGWYATDYGGAKSESAGKSTESKSETSNASSPKEESAKS